MATLFSDNFDRADNTNIGANYTEVYGTWDITGNLLVLTTHSGGGTVGFSFATCDANLNETPAGDYDVEAVFNWSTTGSGSIYGRATDVDNAYQARISTVSQYLRLEKIVTGTRTTLGSQYNGGQSTGNNYTIKLAMASTSLTVYQDTTSRITATDSAHTDGKPGFSGDSSGKTFNNFAVYGTAASASTVKQLAALGVG